MYIMSSSGKLAYGIKELLVDTEQEKNEIDITKIYPGSTVFVVETSKKYILNTNKEWDIMNNSEGGFLPLPGTTIIYDGGVITQSPRRSFK